MPLRTTATRLGVLVAGAALAAYGATVPAAAQDDPGRNAHATGQNAHATARKAPVTDYKAPVYKGRVTAKSGLLLRDAPTRGGRVVRTEPHGKVVTIYCKTKGDRVGRTNHWYLLTDGTWAWGSANYIANIGKSPRWC
ncbi:MULTISPECIES: SH3 domain-containing protein [Streptomyces]|uniref:SH3 domain-containing protein n=1 Tax=Streptomyces TaxID=1883 RepID=UPI001E56D140|nr:MULTISPECIES: SH3 domain-containing protein [Streptomyces]UFQ18035.1 SH3 domain-containing protein [Streptomyces huasconensis]WCL87646.1 SH3 domain-containing protein [Streptomyces sp. JCM 35825]